MSQQIENIGANGISIPVADAQARASITQLSNSLTQINNYLLENKTVSGATTLNANSAQSFSLDVTKTGYTPKAVLSVFTSNSKVAVGQFGIINDSDITLIIVNPTSTAQSIQVSATVMYLKN